MSDPYSRLIPEARAFLSELAENNAREWFLANKSRYDTELKTPAKMLMSQIAGDLGTLTGDPVSTKLFRPHRDVRFSKDKTPYHTHLHMLWTTQAGGRQSLGWYVGIAADYVSVGAGLMGMEKDTLTAWRAAMNGTQGAEMAAMLDGLVATGARLSKPELQRVPAPYDKDHAQGDLLRRKSLSLWFDYAEADVANNGLTGSIMTALTMLKPVQDALRPLL